MFKSARLKLAAWYLLIIMTISGLFSLVIYQGFLFEMNRGLHRAEVRSLKPQNGLNLDGKRWPIAPEDIETIEEGVIFRLIVANGVILFFSAIAGYFLAGQTLKPIEEAMEKQNQFIADASHELRTPITALKAAIEVTLRNKKNSKTEMKKILKSNLEDINHLQTLTEGLLKSARYGKSNQHVDFDLFDIQKTAQRAVRQMAPLASEKNIKLTLKSASQIFEGNKKSIFNLLIILLDNALKYTPKNGQIGLKTETVKNKLVIEIKDSGVGIDKKDLPFIFDRFYKADRSRLKTNTPGFGLGLSLLKKIVQTHQGSIGVSSSLDKGTTFTVKLPLKRA